MIFQTLIAGDVSTPFAVRQPRYGPDPMFEVNNKFMACNENPYPANETVEVAAGSKIGFGLDPRWPITHPGPAFLYLGKVPEGIKVEDWDGSGNAWFKVTVVSFTHART